MRARLNQTSENLENSKIVVQVEGAFGGHLWSVFMLSAILVTIFW